MADLAELGIAYQLVEHEPVFTVEESSRLHCDIPGAHTKNLFLKDAGERFWLVTVPAEVRVDLKNLPQAIGSKRLSFGHADDMLRLLGIRPGSVTPLAAINDLEQWVTVVVDRRLASARRINVHPLRNDATIGLRPDDMLRALEYWNHCPLSADVPVVI